MVFSRTLRRRSIAECSKGEVTLKVTFSVTIQSRVKFHRHPAHCLTALATTRINTTAHYNLYRSFSLRSVAGIGLESCVVVYQFTFYTTQKSKFSGSSVMLLTAPF
jgi:hypothetical protein